MNLLKFLLVLCLPLLLGSAPVRADLLISPTRVLLGGKQATARVTLRNTGHRTRTYRMEWREMRRDEEGNYVNIPAPLEADRIASPMLRFAPRLVTLKADETQSIRIQYQVRSGLPAGEYRSHLRFVSTDAEAEAGEENGVLKAGASGARIRIGLAYSIPVILRVGEIGAEGDVNVSLTRVQPRAEQGSDGVRRLALALSLARSGLYSSFGDLNITMQAEAGAPLVLMGKAADFSIFADAEQRSITVPLREGVEIPKGAWMRVSYEGRQEFGGRVFAEQVFQIR